MNPLNGQPPQIPQPVGQIIVNVFADLSIAVAPVGHINGNIALMALERAKIELEKFFAKKLEEAAKQPALEVADAGFLNRLPKLGG
jgi:hypothetical protein